MKNQIKIFIISAMLLTPVIVMAQKVINYTLVGKVGDIPSTAKVYLVYRTAAGRQVDSAEINHGNFSFKGKIDDPIVAHLVINYKGSGLMGKSLSFIKLYLEAGNIEIISPDSLENAQIKAGQLNADNYTLNQALKPIDEKIEALRKEYRSASDKQKHAQDFNDDLELRYRNLQKAQKQVNINFIKANPNSMISLFTLKDLGEPASIEEVEPLFNILSNQIKSSEEGIKYAAKLAEMKKLPLGSLAPDFSQPDTSGMAVFLHDFKGKYVLVDFWASWCVPCRGENPNLVKAFSDYKDKGFTILGVSLDLPGAKNRWLKAINADHVTWTQLSDLKGWNNEVAKIYAVHAIPENFLVGPDGRIVAKNLRGEDLNKKLKELLDK